MCRAEVVVVVVVGHAVRLLMEKMGNASVVIAGKRPLGRPTSRWGNN
jgi:hypothetical protein